VDGTKYVSKEGAEKLYDLRADPGEQQPFEGDGNAILASREALAAGVGHPVRLALRITPSGHASVSTPVEVRVPGGIEEAWIGDDPTQKSEATIRRPDDETLIASFTGAYGVQREVFVIPRRPMSEVTQEVTIRMNRPGSQAVSLEFAPPGSETLVLGRISTGGRGYQVTWAVLPTPFGNGTVAADAEMNAALQAIGYQQNDRAPAGP
jgi:hypothetical protein